MSDEDVMGFFHGTIVPGVVFVASVIWVAIKFAGLVTVRMAPILAVAFLFSWAVSGSPVAAALLIVGILLIVSVGLTLLYVMEWVE